ncbi:ITA1 protein, partial [Corythaeola cristata]|nr:ITA1 protein [Corythaeola cristata]
FFCLIATTDQQAASFEMEMSQAGFSAHYSQDWIMLGAVGAYDWNGTVLMVKDSGISMPTNDTFRDRLSEKNEPLAAYLGYTVNSALTPGGILYIAGQPRYNHTGQVIIYKMEGREVRVLQRLNGEQIGSYFGGVITTIDIDRDSFTDLLLVGAPMYMGIEKEEQGKVYVYGLNKTKFEYQMSLEPIKQTCCSPLKQDTCKVLKNEPCGARFGTAIAAVKDLNLDGYNDIVIGSPLEDDHRGAVYIYHGRGNTISKKYSQTTTYVCFNVECCKFFKFILKLKKAAAIIFKALSLFVVLLRSRDVAEVNVSMQFTPKSINIQQQNCQINKRKTICINATICFKSRLKSKEDTFESSLQYWITLDSQRQISRSLFTETHERKMQKNITIGGSECIKHNFYMLASKSFKDKPDFQDSVKVLLEFNFSDPESGPVLDSNLPNSISEYLLFMLKTDSKVKMSNILTLFYSSSPFIVKSRNDKFTIQLSVKNKKDSAYNTRVLVQYSPNIIFAGIEDIQKDSCESNHNITCKVGYPFLKPAEEISFKISFQFNASYLLENATIHVYATSDSEEPPETLRDNRGHVTIPVKYEVGLIFVSVFKEHHVIIAANDTVPTAINTTEQIGDEVTLHYRITPLSTVLIGKDLVLLCTSGAQSPNAICQTSYPVDPLKISTGKPFVLPKIKEPTKDTIMGCDTYSCASINCALVPSDIYQVNVSLRVWKPTIIKASIHSLTLVVKALLRSENSSLILRNDHQKLETMIKISKELPPGTVPLWVILLSIFAGLLILALLIFALWKAGFFKRPLKKKMEK